MFAFTWESPMLKVTVVLEVKASQLRKFFKLLLVVVALFLT